MPDKCERCIHRNVCMKLECCECDDRPCDECHLYYVCKEDSNDSEIQKCYSFVDKNNVVEVKHGEWITPTKINGRTFDIPHCSVCENVPCDKGKYCPNCGAKMDGKGG